MKLGFILGIGMMGRDNVRQHVVPRFYLEGFAGDDGKIHVLQINSGKAFPTTPRNVGWEKECFTILRNQKRDTSSDDVNQTIESYCAPKIKSLTPDKTPTSDQLQAIWCLTANLIVRSRQVRDSLKSSLENAKEIASKLSDIIPNDEIPEIEDDLNNARQSLYPALVTSGIEPIAQGLSKLNYSVLFAPANQYFLTSDDPPIVFDEDKPVTLRIAPNCLQAENRSIFLPLNPKMAILWSNQETELEQRVTPEMMKRYNESTATSAYREVYSHDPALLTF